MIVCLITVYKVIFQKSSKDSKDEVYQITSNNYTNILKAVYEDLDTYIGQKISFSGYVYRVYDFKDNEFVLARDMVVSSNFQTLVVGFMCSCDNARDFKDNSWVELSGKITKGYYHGDIPVIKVENIKEINKPSDSTVYPPQDFYIPTSSLLYNNL